jgi:hypothetical protein
VEEIKDDLGVTSDQYAARLKAQGINATKIDTKGGVEDEDSKAKGGQSLAGAYAASPQIQQKPAASKNYAKTSLW